MIIPALFSSVLMLILMNTYTTHTLVYALPVLFCSYGTMRYCAYCHYRNPKVYYTPVFFIVGFITLFIVNLTDSDISFSFWLFYNISEIVAPFVYYIAVFIAGCFYISSAVYYFTHVRFRPVYLLLVVFIVLLFNDRREIAIPGVLTALAAGVFAVVLIIYAQDFKGARPDYTKWLIAGIAVFIFIVALPFARLPNPEHQAGQTLLNRGFGMLSGLMGYSGRSGSADTRYLDERIVFRVNAPIPMYLMRQSYDLFDGKEWFLVQNIMPQGFINWEDTAKAQNIDDLAVLIRTAMAQGLLPDVILPEGLTAVEFPITAGVDLVSGVNMQYFPAPLRTYGILSAGGSARNGRGEIYSTQRRGNSDFYTILCYAEVFRYNEALRTFSAQFDTDSFNDMLDELISFGITAQTPVDAAFGYKISLSEADILRDVWQSAYNSGRDNAVMYSQRLQSLVDDIVKDAQTDYEKASAIEQYFLTGGYVYDLGFPSYINDDIEAFIFEEKAGICVHYASAMTIMARMAGLNARYAEGFYSSEQDRDGRYIVRAKYAHAFVQIYFPAYGWVTFDPTVPSSGSGEGVAGIIRSIAAVIFTYFSAAVVGWVVIYLFIIPPLRAVIFHRRVLKSPPVNGIKILYYDTKRLLNKITNAGTNIPAFELNILIKDTYGIDMDNLVKAYNIAAFAENTGGVGIAEVKAAYAEYAGFYRKVTHPILRLRTLLQS